MGDLFGMNAPAAEKTDIRCQRHDRRSSGGWVARRLRVGVAALFALGALPAAAGAADYCVAPNTSCGGTNLATLQGALDQAAGTAEPDRVFLGAFIYPAPDSGGYSYHEPSSPVEIVGQGSGQTILTSPAGGGDAVVSFAGGPGSSIRDLTIRLPFQSVSGLAGLITSNTARRIDVIEHQTQSNSRTGVQLQHGGTLEDSSVTLGGFQGDANAVGLGSGGATVRRSTLSARVGVRSAYGGTIERSRVTGVFAGVLASSNLTEISGSLIHATAANGNGIGILALTKPGLHTSVHADGVTITGPGAGVAHTYGASASNETALAESAEIGLTNAIIRGVAHPLYAAAAGTGQAKISASYSDFDPSGNLAYGGPNASITETNVSNVGDAGFADAAAGDYHLLSSSPLVDAGDPATAQGLDLDGNPLVTDGNHNGTARRDLGAFEVPGPLPAQNPAGGEHAVGQQVAPPLDTQAPLVTGFRVTTTRRGPRLRYTLSEAAKVTLGVQRAVRGSRTRYRTIGALTRNGARGMNSTRLSARLRKRVSRPGRYRVRITATDSAGNRSARRTARFRTATR